MRMYRRNLVKYYLFKPTKRRSKDDSIFNEYKRSCCTFLGNIQPVKTSQRSISEEYGVSLERLYNIFVQPNTPFNELDRIGTTAKTQEFEVKSAEKWRSYWKLLVERLDTE